MADRSPHHADVFSHLPVALMRELDSPPVAALLDELLAAGWLPGQLRHRVGAEPTRDSADLDAAHVLELLRGLGSRSAPRELRVHPACSLCNGEGVLSVVDVPLCRRCADLIASGQARLEQPEWDQTG